MAQSPHPWLALGVLLAAAPALLAQAPAVTDPPAAAPAPRPPTREELDRQEAVRLYGVARVQERDSLLIEAIESLEKAVRLDPDAARPYRALFPLYLAVDRPDDALRACRRVLDLEPGDYETWYLYARQLKVLGKSREAIDALEKAAACPGIKERPELRLQVHFDLGGLHEAAEEFDKAEAAFGVVVDLLDRGEVPPADQPGAPGPEELATQAAETCERLGRVAVRAGHFDRAVAAYRKAQEKDPQRRQRLCYNLADVFIGEGKLEEGLASLDEYLKTQPQGTEAYERKIDLLRRLGRPGEIVPSLERSAAVDAQNQALQLLLARQYALAGRGRDAEQVYQRLLKDSPTADVYRGLFTLYRERGPSGAGRVVDLLDAALARGAKTDTHDGDPNEAAKARAMLLVLRDDADLVKAILPVVRQRLLVRRALRPETSRYLALLADRAHELEDAERLYRDCLASSGPAQANEPEVYIGLLRVLEQQHKDEAVVEVCRQGLSRAQATNLILFHYDLSRALARLGKTDEALAEATRAVEIATKDDERRQTRHNRVWILALAGKTDEAEAECRDMLKEVRGKGEGKEEVQEVRYALSEVYSLARKYPQAEEQLQIILEHNVTEARARNDLGYIWADQGKNLAEAEKLIREAIDLDREQKRTGTRVEADSDRDNAAYLDSLGWVLFKRGRLEEARREMEKACRLPEGADDPVVWDHAGDVYARLGDTARAREAWRKAADLYDGGHRPRDDRRADIEHKLKLLEPAAGN